MQVHFFAAARSAAGTAQLRVIFRAPRSLLPEALLAA